MKRQRIFATALIILLILFLSIIGGLFYQELSALGAEHLLSNLGFFMLMNLNIVVLMVLGFLVVKNIVKLVLDRRRKILGAQLRTRLVLAFVGLALVPTVLLFTVSRGIVGSVLQGWFSPQVAATVDGALGVAKFHYDAVEEDVYRETYYLSQQILDVAQTQATSQTNNIPAGGLEDAAPLRALLESRLREYGLSHIALMTQSGEIVAETASAAVGGSQKFDLESVRRAGAGAILVRPEQSLSGEYLRGYAPISPHAIPERILRPGTQQRPSALDLPTGPPAVYIVVTSVRISSELRKLMSEVIDAYDNYKEVRSYRRLVSQGYLLSLVVVTFFVLVAAIWVGFYLARMISVPIQHLAAGTQEVARGNLEFRIPEIGGDELSILVHSFNQMTGDLKRTTGELVARRKYMETVLASVGVGVISVDPRGKVTTVNPAAVEILNLPQEALDGTPAVHEVMPPRVAEEIQKLLQQNLSTPTEPISSTVSLTIAGENRQIQVSASPLLSDNGEDLGTVFLFDDLTELVSAQRMAAWQDVARRIAHEIKNPLTPIQLSAQRIQKRLGDGQNTGELSENERRIALECAEAVVRQVETLRVLVNEFSRFARMPKSQPAPMDLNTLVRETVRVFQDGNPEIQFVAELDGMLPVVELDREQMSRVLLNLLANAVAAVRAASAENAGRSGEVRVATLVDANLGMLSLVVADNGIGIPDADKPRLFEPYFSRREGGTGLGLAIVSSIIADHSGFIRVRDNLPHGAMFVVELPIRESRTKKPLVSN
ncbi:MAG: PAS domain-containing protein [Deltaproteobacteria bacterium]|nr:PAS domain-containing protein [Deltaproteobacteria bacterium]